VESSIRALNEIILSFDLRPTPEARSVFARNGQQLRQWVAARQASSPSPRERALMGQIGGAVESYLSRGGAFFDERAGVGIAMSSELVWEQVSENARPVLRLCQELNTAEQAALELFVKDSYRALGWLQRLFVVSLALLAIFTGAMALSLYRGTIAPLRVKLIQSRAIIERDEKLAALGTMAAGMAHEIRNPLTAVNVRLHSLTRTLIPGSSEHEDAFVIGNELQRLDRMLRQFLQFARPANPKMVTLSADYLLRKIEAITGPHLAKASIRLDVESTPDSWIHCDPDQIEQVLVNLVKNAAESIGAHGGIVLRARANSARLGGRSTDEVILEVSDTGPGVAPEVQPRLFDPFFTTKEGGTGLGLSIAARIVEQHGGTILCHSAVKHGATFHIALPSAEKNENEPSSADPAG
jgi:signal transduction histidine kinase